MEERPQSHDLCLCTLIETDRFSGDLWLETPKFWGLASDLRCHPISPVTLNFSSFEQRIVGTFTLHIYVT